jgi:hypothetical protein
MPGLELGRRLLLCGYLGAIDCHRLRAVRAKSPMVSSLGLSGTVVADVRTYFWIGRQQFPRCDSALNKPLQNTD